MEFCLIFITSNWQENWQEKDEMHVILRTVYGETSKSIELSMSFKHSHFYFFCTYSPLAPFMTKITNICDFINVLSYLPNKSNTARSANSTEDRTLFFIMCEFNQPSPNNLNAVKGKSTKTRLSPSIHYCRMSLWPSVYKLFPGRWSKAGK